MAGRQRAPRAVSGLLLVGGLLGGAWGAGAAGAGSLDRSFSASAEAAGGYVRYGIPGFLIVENYIDGGGPVVQAAAGSDGSAQSFASNPYPGPTAIGFPGLAAVVLGSAPPGYPLYASAQHPSQPEQKVADPTGSYSLAASADEGRARGEARGGPSAGDGKAIPVSEATSEVTSDAHGVTASALSVTQVMSVGPLHVASVRSQSVTSYQVGAPEATTKTDLRVNGTVGDMSFGYGPEGFQVGKNGVPLPAADGLAAINAALAPAGVSIRFGAVEPLPGGAAAETFEILSTADVPGAGKGTLSMRFGGAKSSITLGGAEAASVMTDFPPGTPAAAASPDSGAGSPATAGEPAPAPSTPAPSAMDPAATTLGPPEEGQPVEPVTQVGADAENDRSEPRAATDEDRSEARDEGRSEARAAAYDGRPEARALASVAGALAALVVLGVASTGVWVGSKKVFRWTA